MRPPSYYASLSSYNYTTTGSGSSYNPSSSSSSHLNRSSSSHQLRSSFSSPSSASYVTRSHLPFVPQSMLVAHCFTGVSSSTKPNYGHHQSSMSLSPSSYSTTSGGPSTYSTSYSRPKSLKRYQPVTTASGSVGSSYLSSASVQPSSRVHSNYPTSGNAGSGSNSYKRPPTSSYYPKPIRLRERPLLTQISRQFNTTSSSYRPSATRVAADESIHSKSRNLDAEIAKKVAPIPPIDAKQEEEKEKNWSSDVARNISRNKYLIKFREFEKTPAGPIQLTNSVEEKDNNSTRTNLLPDPDCSTPENHTKAEPEHTSKPRTVPEVPRVEPNKQRESSINKVISDPPSMKVPSDESAQRADGLGYQPSTLDDGPQPIKVGAKTKAVQVEPTPTVGIIQVDNGNQKQDQPQLDTEAAQASKIDGELEQRVPKEKRNIKLRIRTMGSPAAKVPAPPPQATSSSEPQHQVGVEERVKKSKGSPVIDKSELLENQRMETTQSNANGSSDNVSVGQQSVLTSKPKVKRLAKTSSSKAAAAASTKATQPSSPEVKVATTSLEKPPIQAKENNSPPVTDSVFGKNKPTTAKQATKQTATGSKAKGERRKSALKLEPDSDNGDGGEKIKKVLAPSKQREQIIEFKMQPEAAKQQQQQQSNNSELVRKPEVKEDTRLRVVQENKRIRFRDYHLEDFNFLSVLGHGGWGFVILAELKEHDACFAVKCIKKITIVEDDDFDSIMIERKVLTLGNVHPFICKLFCTFETEGYLFFVMEYCPGGDLMFHVQKDGKFTESRCRFYAAEIICAIRFLHNRHIIYRDLKLDNILLDSRGHIRLVDFGMCQCRTYREEMLPSNFCGTPEYISPEIIKGVPYNHSVDWWSFGVLLYEMAVGKMPFRGNDENELLWNVCYEQIHYPMFLTKELTLLLQSLLEREPTKRMGMATCKAGDIYDQAWFRGVDWAAMEEMRVPPPFIPEVNSKRDVQNFDADFTESKAELSPIDESTLQRIDQTQFQKFPYTNPDIFIFDSL